VDNAALEKDKKLQLVNIVWYLNYVETPVEIGTFIIFLLIFWRGTKPNQLFDKKMVGFVLLVSIPDTLIHAIGFFWVYGLIGVNAELSIILLAAFFN
jgi:hypothetical protein